MSEMDENQTVEVKISKTRKDWNVFRKIFATLIVLGLLTIAGFYIQFGYRYSIYVVEGPSMQPTLNEFSLDGHDGKYDSVYVNLRDGFSAGDVIVFEHDGDYLIKRYIAKAGDAINIVGVDAQTGTISGTTIPAYSSYNVLLKKKGETGFSVLDETAYISEEHRKMEAKYVQLYKYKSDNSINQNEAILIPEGCLFAMGDNRDNSSDCAVFGPVLMTSVLGKVDFILKYNTTTLGKLWYKFKIRFIIK